MHRLTQNENGLEILGIENDAATAKIALQGAHLFDYTLRGETPLLWVSGTARFEPGRTVRGGVPVCWPWFGQPAGRPELPQHGFARTALWRLADIAEPSSDRTVARFILDDTMVEQPWFPHPFRLRLEITVGPDLELSLTTENTGEKPFKITEALHTYFRIGDIGKVKITGLENVRYHDALDEWKLKSSPEPIRFDRETDRVYIDTEESCTLEDPALEREITVEKSGSASTVVWNPWTEKAERMEDFDDEGYRRMLCIETANAAKNAVTVPPGGEHTVNVRLYSRSSFL